MIHYIIKVISTIERKDKSTWEMVSYYKETSFVIIPMNHLTGNIDEAKKFDCKSEAKRTLARYFGKSQRYSIERIVTPD